MKAMSVSVRKWVAPILALIVPKGCSTVAILADCRVGAFFGFDYALIAAMSG
jgi:hypothetical protein